MQEMVFDYRQLDFENATNYILNSKHQLDLEKKWEGFGCFWPVGWKELIVFLPTTF